MSTLEEKVADFLSQKRIAVAGVSRTKQDAANLIYKKLKEAGSEVFAVNPNAQSFGDDPCYPDLKSIPGGVGGVVIVTRPSVTEDIVRQCAEAGVTRVWMHQSMMKSVTSVSQEAAKFCEEHGITVIDGACPMMFCQPVDFGHKCMRWMMRLTGGLPK
jgi:uncharacterized protein